MLAITTEEFAGADSLLATRRLKFSDGNVGSGAGFENLRIEGMLMHKGARSTWKEEERPR